LVSAALLEEDSAAPRGMDRRNRHAVNTADTWRAMHALMMLGYCDAGPPWCVAARESMEA